MILKYAGRDATEAYVPIHPPDALEKNIPASKHLGPLSWSAIQTLLTEQKRKTKSKDDVRVENAMRARPPLKRILSLADMEVGLQPFIIGLFYK